MKENKSIISEDQALKKLQEICSRQEKCSFDIEQKLKIWNISDSSQVKILQKLEKNSFIDDQRYAIAFTKDKLKFNKWGRIKIGYALAQKRIPQTIIDIALNEIDENEYLVILRQEMVKKLYTIQSKSKIEKKKKLLQFMLSKGFENGKVFDMLNEELK